MESFDHIVVGGGSSGCVVAGELAKDPSLRVLLLEAGPAAEEHPETLTADNYTRPFINDAVMCERFSVPQEHSARQRMFAGTGTVLGGSGSVNAMVYTRGAREDYAEWPSGWHWEDVESEYEAIEKILLLNRRPPSSWTEDCLRAAEENGFSRKDDFNDGRIGNVVGYEWMTFAGDRRRSAYVAFLKDAGERPNLTVLPHACARRVLFTADRRAEAVEYEHGGRIERASARGEIVLCAGALETPKLLMLSGVGPGEHLRSFGIPVVADRPAVGAHLQDHPNAPVFFRANRALDSRCPQLYSFFRTNESSDLPRGQSDTCYVYWPGPAGMKNVTQRMLPPKVVPHFLYGPRSRQIVRNLVGAAFEIGALQRFCHRLFNIVVILGKPKSRGTLRLQSTDVREQARIDPAYYSHPEDMATMILGVRRARQIAGARGLAGWEPRELMPGRRAQSDEAIAKYVRANTMTTYHFAGTCRMGTSEADAVDTELVLRGVTGLRVADASAIPSTPVSALNAPSMLIGFRAAKLMRSRGGRGAAPAARRPSS